MKSIFYAEWRALKASLIIVTGITAAAFLALVFCREYLPPDSVVLYRQIICLILPPVWISILFESFAIDRNELVFTCSMPVLPSRIFLVRLVPRLLIAATASILICRQLNAEGAWREISMNQPFVSMPDFYPCMLMIFGCCMLAGSMFGRGILLPFGAILAALLIALSQAPAVTAFLCLWQKFMILCASIQASILLLLISWLLWRRRCQNQSLWPGFIQIILVLFILPWLEFGATYIYQKWNYQHILGQIDQSRLYVIPQKWSNRLYRLEEKYVIFGPGGTKVFTNSKEAQREFQPLLDELLKDIHYRPGDLGWSAAMIHGNGSYFFHNAIHSGRPFDEKKIKIFLALYGYHLHLPGRLLQNRQEAEECRRVIQFLEPYLDIKPPNRYLMFEQELLDLYWTRRKYIDSILMQPKLYSAKCETLCFIREYLDTGRISISSHYYQTTYGVLQSNNFKIKRDLVQQKLLLYRYENGHFPDQLPGDIQQFIDANRKYRKTDDGYIIAYHGDSGFWLRYPIK